MKEIYPLKLYFDLMNPIKTFESNFHKFSHVDLAKDYLWKFKEYKTKIEKCVFELKLGYNLTVKKITEFNAGLKEKYYLKTHGVK